MANSTPIPGAIIVPAYLGSEGALERLEDSLASLPDSLPGRRIAVVQFGPEGAPASCPRSYNGTTVVTSDRPLGKWGAVSLGLQQLEQESWVVVFDGDAAYHGRDAERLAAAVSSGQYDHVVGRRDRVALESADQINGHTRLYLEAYFNTLVVLSLDETHHERFSGIDLQCGLHAFTRDRFDRSAVQEFPRYGGEVLLFRESAAGNYRVGTVDVTSVASRPSAYTVDEIVAELLRLDFIAQQPRAAFQQAIDASLDAYHDWIHDPADFRQQIQQLVLSVL